MTTAPAVPAFEAILDLEFDVRSAQVAITFRPIGLPDYLAAAQVENLRSAKAKLYAAVAALTLDELAAYGAYRAAVRR